MVETGRRVERHSQGKDWGRDWARGGNLELRGDSINLQTHVKIHIRLRKEWRAKGMHNLQLEDIKVLKFV